MDWLMEHQKRSCHGRKQKKLLIKGDLSHGRRKVGSQGFRIVLSLCQDVKIVEPKVNDIWIISEFPKELPELPLNRQVEFEIEVMPGTAPVSIDPYCMVPNELKELKI
ncbi:Retrotransposon protein [Gossypium australe]|uniref:Retrotransposon protein n=1 Tax=Gossypium australe TaxID=47621 RepID=A0A5B6VWK1_9ROSI|nr:Retrotransposon protein [Gossypium australe]